MGTIRRRAAVESTAPKVVATVSAGCPTSGRSLASDPPPPDKGNAKSARASDGETSRDANRLKLGQLEPHVLAYLKTNAESGPHGPTTVSEGARALLRRGRQLSQTAVIAFDASRVVRGFFFCALYRLLCMPMWDGEFLRMRPSRRPAHARMPLTNAGARSGRVGCSDVVRSESEGLACEDARITPRSAYGEPWSGQR
jgi:hypothetical protein